MASSSKGIFYPVDFGKIVITLKPVMDKQGITRNALAQLTGAKYDVITRYYLGEGIERIDLPIMAKFCYVLGCTLNDLMQYVPPEK